MLYVFSDPHFHHKRAIKHSRRPFVDEHEMNKAMWDNINREVGPEDWLVCLGDWVYGVGRDDCYYVQKCQEARDAIRCKNMIFVAGNHDRPWLKDFRRLFTEFYPEGSSSQFGGLELKLDARNRDRFGLGREFENELLILCHYRLFTWRSSRHGSKHIHGHSHGSLDHIVTRNCLDAGVDCWNYRAPSIVEIYNRFDAQRHLPLSDHHPERLDRTAGVK